MRRFAAPYSERLRSLRVHVDIAHIMRARAEQPALEEQRDERCESSGLRIMVRALCRRARRSPLRGWG